MTKPRQHTCDCSQRILAQHLFNLIIEDAWRQIEKVRAELKKTDKFLKKAEESNDETQSCRKT